MKSTITHLRYGFALLLAIFFTSQVNGQTGCQAAFTFNTALNSLAVNFSDASTSPNTITAWSWNFGDNTTSTGQNPSHSYALPGTYNVCLTIHDAHGCTSHFCHSVVVHHPHHPHHDSIAHNPHDSVPHHPHDSVPHHPHHDTITHHPHDSVPHHPHHPHAHHNPPHHPHHKEFQLSENTKEDFSIFPNPATDELNININNSSDESSEIRLASLTGKVIYSQQLQLKTGENNFSIPLRSVNIESGIYFLTFNQGYNIITRKIIVR